MLIVRDTTISMGNAANEKTSTFLEFCSYPIQLFPYDLTFQAFVASFPVSFALSMNTEQGLGKCVASTVMLCVFTWPMTHALESAKQTKNYIPNG
ncbi:hypothetical protein NPIL_544831 [Nephila pilipes]|uniref:Uncharacterized protein n=1 Tax=Nephila pilipes TaxID=299642 RepID=A0A8X6P6F8_NEPPI|nr:hypothetical protein NPIL_544831 [Nephila pilipes]